VNPSENLVLIENGTNMGVSRSELFRICSIGMESSCFTYIAYALVEIV
jgi:hypothetical protein